MADVAQLVRASGCGSEGRGFNPLHSPQAKNSDAFAIFVYNGSYAPVAQWIEQETSKLLAVGSIPTRGTKFVSFSE